LSVALIVCLYAPVDHTGHPID